MYTRASSGRTYMAMVPKALLLAAILSCVCFCFCFCSSSSPAGIAAGGLDGGSSNMTAAYARWVAQYGRVYKDDAEKARRFDVFKANVEFIDAFNAGNHKFWLGVNQFADLTDDEFRAQANSGYRRGSARIATGFKYGNVSLDVIPETVDWRTKDAVTPIKDQGRCASCWAFSAVAAMEGIVKLTTGELVSLSEQELVDCDVHGWDKGCEGGAMDEAFEFIISNAGLSTESSYPYTKEDGKCKSESNRAVTIKGYENVPGNNEAALMKAVANQPVSVAVDVDNKMFQFYKGGVMDGSCGIELGHDITTIGYGKTDDGTKYWLLKNSWGTSWGETGYFRMKKDISDKRGLCGLAMEPCYPF